MSPQLQVDEAGRAAKLSLLSRKETVLQRACNLLFIGTESKSIFLRRRCLPALQSQAGLFATG